MLRIALLFGFVLLTGASAQAEEICSPRRAAVLDGAREGSDRLFVPVTMAGRQTYLAVHLSSAWSFIEERLADALQLKRKKMRTIEFVGASGKRYLHYVVVPNFRLGGLLFNEPDFVIEPDDGSDFDIGRYGGTLGVEILSSYDVEIDNANKSMTLYRPDIFCSGRLVRWADKWVEIPFTFNDEIPLLRAVIDGEEVRTTLNTASTSTVMDLDLASSRFGIKPDSPGVKKVQDGVYSYTFKKLSISGFDFENIEVLLIDYEETQLSLGMNVIKRLHLYIAFKRKIIYATRLDAHK